MNLDEQIAILVATKAGKSIQLSSRDDNPRKWVDLRCPKGHRYNFINYDYREKPEPLVLYANVYRHEDGIEFTGAAVDSDRNEVLRHAGANVVRRGAKFVEVIEDKSERPG